MVNVQRPELLELREGPGEITELVEAHVDLLQGLQRPYLGRQVPDLVVAHTELFQPLQMLDVLREMAEAVVTKIQLSQVTQLEYWRGHMGELVPAQDEDAKLGQSGSQTLRKLLERIIAQVEDFDLLDVVGEDDFLVVIGAQSELAQVAPQFPGA